MEITSNGGSVTINGNIKSISDFQAIKSHIDGLIDNNSSISINLKDSISITSSIIGYFTKLIYKDNIQLSLRVGDQRLYDLLDELGLTSQFNVSKA